MCTVRAPRAHRAHTAPALYGLHTVPRYRLPALLPAFHFPQDSRCHGRWVGCLGLGLGLWSAGGGILLSLHLFRQGYRRQIATAVALVARPLAAHPAELGTAPAAHVVAALRSFNECEAARAGLGLPGSPLSQVLAAGTSYHAPDPQDACIAPAVEQRLPLLRRRQRAQRRVREARRAVSVWALDLVPAVLEACGDPGSKARAADGMFGPHIKSLGGARQRKRTAVLEADPARLGVLWMDNAERAQDLARRRVLLAPRWLVAVRTRKPHPATGASRCLQQTICVARPHVFGWAGDGRRLSTVCSDGHGPCGAFPRASHDLERWAVSGAHRPCLL